jgi:hypothetical protein
MAFTHTQENFDIPSIKTVVINPSVMEGERGNASLLGPKTAVPLDRIAPFNVQLPTITGEYSIPSVLTCQPGVWGGSPKPQLFYQWLDNGEEIPGETGKTLTTILDFDKHTMSCRVTAVSRVGVAEAETAGVYVETIQPIRVEDNYYGVISGLNQTYQQNIMRHDHNVVTGMWVDPRLDANQKIELVATGMWVDTRVDVESHTVMPIQGLHLPQTQKVYAEEAYVQSEYIYLGAVNLPNNKADPAIGMTNWVMPTAYDAWTVSSSTYSFGGKAATNVFWSGTIAGRGINNGTPPYFSTAHRIDAIDAAHHAKIDAGEVELNFHYWAWINNWQSLATSVELDFLDANDVVLGSHEGHGAYGTYAHTQLYWCRYTTSRKVVPVGTRKVKLRLKAQRGSYSDGTNTYMDEFAIDLWTMYK